MFIFRTRPKEEGEQSLAHAFWRLVCILVPFPALSVLGEALENCSSPSAGTEGALCWRLRKIMHRKCLTHRRFSIDPPPLLFIYFCSLYYNYVIYIYYINCTIMLFLHNFVTYYFFPGGAVVKSSPANTGAARNTCSIPGLGRTPGGGHGNPLQYSCLENPMDRGAWRVAKIWTWLRGWACMHTCNILYFDVCTYNDLYITIKYVLWFFLIFIIILLSRGDRSHQSSVLAHLDLRNWWAVTLDFKGGPEIWEV